jgi:hypothetical protein
MIQLEKDNKRDQAEFNRVNNTQATDMFKMQDLSSQRDVIIGGSNKLDALVQIASQTS